MVRYLIVVFIAVAPSLDASRCRRIRDVRSRLENCSYSSFAQCVETVRGLRASCQRNPFPGTNFGRGYGGTEGRGNIR
jgi:Protein of unknown function (DUF3551)